MNVCICLMVMALYKISFQVLALSNVKCCFMVISKTLYIFDLHSKKLNNQGLEEHSNIYLIKPNLNIV